MRVRIEGFTNVSGLFTFLQCTGAGFMQSYAGLDGSAKATLEGANGLALPLDEGTANGFGDLLVTVIPAPSAMPLFGDGALVMMRRRR